MTRENGQDFVELCRQKRVESQTRMQTPFPLVKMQLPELPQDWVWVSLSEICQRVSVGHVGPTTPFFDKSGEGIPFARSQDVRPGRLMIENVVHITKDFHQKLKKSQLKAGDVLIVRVGANRGDVCVVPDGIGELNCANIVFARPMFPNRFIEYYLRSSFGQAVLLSMTTGAAQGVINTQTIAAMPIPIPPLSIQCKIADGLSAYDDLIEVNTRRIRILEQMAQSVHREWFGKVDEKSLPEGWEEARFDDVFDIRYGKNLPTKNMLEVGEFPVYGAGGVIGYHDKCVMKERVPLVTCRGNGSGMVWRTREAAFITNNNLYILPKIGFEHFDFFYIELLLKSANVHGAVSGSAQPQITIEGLSSVTTIIPPKPLVKKFCDTARDIPNLVDTLYRKNANLRRTRDLLLPRLVSGEVGILG